MPVVPPPGPPLSRNHPQPPPPEPPGAPKARLPGRLWPPAPPLYADIGPRKVVLKSDGLFVPALVG